MPELTKEEQRERDRAIARCIKRVVAEDPAATLSDIAEAFGQPVSISTIRRHVHKLIEMGHLREYMVSGDAAWVEKRYYLRHADGEIRRDEDGSPMYHVKMYWHPRRLEVVGREDWT